MSIANDYGIRIDHFGIHIYEMEEACRWYEDLFGFVFEREVPLPVGHFPKARMLDLADFRFEIYEVKNARPFNMEDYDGRIGVKYAGIDVVKYDEWLANAKAKGVNFIAEEENFCYIKDASDVIYKVLRDPKADDKSILRAGPYEARVGHAGLNVYSIEDTAKWYKDAFGFERTPQYDSVCKKSGVKIGAIELKNFVIELYEMPEAKPFDLMNFEWFIGTKHLDLAYTDRKGWTEYLRNDCPSRVPIIVSSGNPVPLPHYVLDNNNMLIEPSDEWYKY